MMWEIPEEPGQNVVWTKDARTGTAIRWTREWDVSRGESENLGWSPDDTTHTWLGIDWTDLLVKHGPVFEEHPDLEFLRHIARPWTADEFGLVSNSTGGGLFMVDVEPAGAIAAFVAKAVNAYTPEGPS